MFDLTFQFDNDKTREHFAMWLCESGEQEYWDWMRVREEEEPGEPITAVEFDYFPGEDGDFIEDGLIETTSGRFDNE